MTKHSDPSPSFPTLPDAVRWYEGMPLMPQHFQQAAARAEMLAPALLRARDPLHWGLLRLELEQDGSHIAVTALEAVMPDGLPVLAGPRERLSIDLALHQPDADGVWRIALALAAATQERRPDPPRYLEHGSVRVADQNPGGADEVISVLRPHVQLVCGHGQGYADNELLPLAQYRKTSALPEDTGYIGPWLRIGPQLALHARIHAFGRKLRAAYAQLAGDPLDATRAVARRALLPSLGALVLELDSLLQNGGSHPQALFGLLARLLGALAAGTGAAALPPLPRFDYRDLAAAFGHLLDALEGLHAHLAPDYDWAPFRSLGRQEFEIAPSLLAGAAPYVVALHKPVRASDEDMRRWFDEALVCSAGRNDRPQHHRIRGIGKTRVATELAHGLGGDAGRTLFQLQVDASAADYFDASLPLRISGPGGSADGYVEPLAIELLLRPRTATADVAAQAGAA